MTKKDYIKLAQALKDSKPTIQQFTTVSNWQGENIFINDSAFLTSLKQWNDTVEMIAATLQLDNPQLSRARFLHACGYTKEG